MQSPTGAAKTDKKVPLLPIVVIMRMAEQDDHQPRAAVLCRRPTAHSKQRNTIRHVSRLKTMDDLFPLRRQERQSKRRRDGLHDITAGQRASSMVRRPIKTLQHCVTQARRFDGKRTTFSFCLGQNRPGRASRTPTPCAMCDVTTKRVDLFGACRSETTKHKFKDSRTASASADIDPHLQWKTQRAINSFPIFWTSEGVGVGGLAGGWISSLRLY